MIKLPREIEVWFVIPSIRRELAKIFGKKHKLKQKQIAKLLDITESAVSQYLKDKRAVGIKFNKKFLKKIEESAHKISKNKKKSIKEIENLCNYFRKNKLICVVHKKHSKLDKKCDICFK